MRPRTLALLLWVVVSVLLSGCQWDGLNLSGSGGATVAVTTELVGPEHLYPLLNARVELNGETQQTKMSGRASFSNVPRDQLATVQAVTDFASVSQQTMVSASMVWHVPIMLPEMMNADEFRNSLFWEGGRNLRWRRGAEIRVYFDYEHAPNMPLAEREAAEAQAIEEFQSWFPPPGHPAPYLRWGGQVSSPGQANVIVHMMHNEAFAEHYPEHSTAAGVGGVRGIDDTGYVTAGQIGVRVDCCAFQKGLYAHELGHVLGFGHPGDLYAVRSVMGYNAIPQANDLDRLMIQVKMHLPPMIYYDLRASAMSDWEIPDPLPLYP